MGVLVLDEVRKQIAPKVRRHFLKLLNERFLFESDCHPLKPTGAPVSGCAEQSVLF